MRMLMTVLAIALAGSAAPAQAPANPYAIVRATPTGSFVHGSAAAKVKLVEWFSMTCPHCAHFAGEAGAELDQRIRSGSTSVEYRHFVFNPLDMTASILARCGGPRRFPANARFLFERQRQWIDAAQGWLGANQAAHDAADDAGKRRQLAQGSGLLAMMRTRGYSAAQLNACLANPAEPRRLAAMTLASRSAVRSTPSFAINGTIVDDAHGWAELRPALIAATGR